MKKFFIVLLILIMLGGSGFAGWYFLLREKPLTIEFYGDFETLSYLSGDGSYKENEIVTLTADEREGYDFESWIKDGNPISSSRIYSFVMSKNTSGKYTATYKAKEFTISTQNNGVYNISNKAATDEMVDISINPPKGYDLEEVYYVIDGSDEKVIIHNNRFKMPPHHISIFINLKEIKYEIKYDLCGGSFETTTISYYTINTPTFTLPHPTQKGYNFIGYMDKQSTAPILNYQIEQGSTKEISVWAEWELAFFDINTVVEGQGSITIGGNAQYQSNEHCGAVAEEGWQLTKLYYIASETGDRVDLVDGYFTMPYYDITVYAIFEKIAYNITVSPSVINGYIEPTQTTSYVGDTVTIVAHPDTGCEVLLYKYSIDNEENWIDIEGNTFIMPASDVVIYASFDAIDYQITYNLDGGTLPQNAPETYRIWDSEVTLPTPTKEGFYFVGWYDNQDFNGENITSFSGYDLEDKVFYAYFQPNQYSVAFYNYDGTLLNTISGPWYYGDIPYNWGDAPTKPSTLEYDFVFAGWTPEIVPVVEDASYTAVFTALPRVYTITKADNITKGNIECVTQSVHSETVIVTATPDSGAELIKTYYIKAGDSVENKVEFTNSFVMPKSNVTIYAEFDLIDYDITYNLDGGTLPNESATSYTIEDTVTLLVPTKAGYDFVGWIVNDGDTPNKNITITKGSTGAKEFTAVWQIQAFTIVWVNDDGTTIETDANVPYGTTPSFDGETPSKAPTAEYEYIFAGWTPTVAVVTQHQTYTATYTSKARTYTITKATIANGNIICKESAAAGEMVDIFVSVDDISIYSVTNIYYIIEGSTENIKISGTQFVMPAANITVYAVVEQTGFIITKASVSNGTISCVASAETGDTVTVSININEGYRLSRTYYIVEGTTTEVDFEGSFTMPASNVTVYAEFEVIRFNITTHLDYGHEEHTESYFAGDLYTIQLASLSENTWAHVYYIGQSSNEKIILKDAVHTDNEQIAFTMPYENIDLYIEYYYPVNIEKAEGCVVDSYTRYGNEYDSITILVTPISSEYSLTSLIVAGIMSSDPLPVTTENLDNGQVKIETQIGSGEGVKVIIVFEELVIERGGYKNLYTESYTMTEETVDDHSATIAGGAFFVGEGSKLTITSGTISNATSDEGGAIYVDYLGEVVIDGGTITNCTATKGAAVYVAKGGVLTINDISITNCSAERGVIYIEDGGTLNFTDGSVSDCNITVVNCLVYAEEGANINIEGGNLSAGEGGYLLSGEYTITFDTSCADYFICATVAEQGSTVTMSLNPPVGYKLTSLYYYCGQERTFVDTETLTFIMPNGNIEFYAYFEEIAYAITILSDHGGTVSGPSSAIAGRTVEMTITQNNGFELMYICYLIDGDNTFTEHVFTSSFIMPNANITIVPYYKKIESGRVYYSIAFHSLGKGYVGGNNYFAAGTNTEMYVDPEPGYDIGDMFYIISGTTTKVPFSYTFTMPANNVAVYVEFKQSTYYAINYSYSYGWITGVSTAAEDSEVTVLTENAEIGYRLTKIFYVGEISGNTVYIDMDTLKFTMPAENISFFVEIEKVVYSITYVVDGNGSIEEPKTDSAEYDDSVMINAIPDSGYKVGSYSCIGQSSGEAIAFDESPIGIAFLMPAEDVIFYITFVEEE